MNRSNLIRMYLFFLTHTTLVFAGKNKPLKFEHKYFKSNIINPNFIISSDHADYYQQLKSLYKLDQLTINATNELEKIAIIMNWVHNLWEHHSDNIPAKKDAYSILNEVFYNHQNFRCVEYATVLTACLWAINIACRKLNLKTQDVETRQYAAGHVVCEAYLPSLKKWVMLDPQANIIIMLHKKPLNAIELQKAIAQNKKISLYSIKTDVTLEQYIHFITPYLFYFDTELEINDPYHNGKKLMLVPLKAKKPTVFQKQIVLDNFIYTHNLKYFYPKLFMLS